jgi:hypothetical protein
VPSAASLQPRPARSYTQTLLSRATARPLGVELGSNDEAIEEAGAEVSDRIEEIAKRANVPEGFVRQLVAAGALPSDEGELGSSRAVRRARLLWSWTAAGLSVEWADR